MNDWKVPLAIATTAVLVFFVGYISGATHIYLDGRHESLTKSLVGIFYDSGPLASFLGGVLALVAGSLVIIASERQIRESKRSAGELRWQEARDTAHFLAVSANQLSTQFAFASCQAVLVAEDFDLPLPDEALVSDARERLSVAVNMPMSGVTSLGSRFGLLPPSLCEWALDAFGLAEMVRITLRRKLESGGIGLIDHQQLARRSADLEELRDALLQYANTTSIITKESCDILVDNSINVARASLEGALHQLGDITVLTVFAANRLQTALRELEERGQFLMPEQC